MQVTLWIVGIWFLIILVAVVSQGRYRRLIKSPYDWLRVMSETEFRDRGELRSRMDRELDTNYFRYPRVQMYSDLEHLVEEGLAEEKPGIREIEGHQISTDYYRLTPKGKSKQSTLDKNSSRVHLLLQPV